MKRDKINIKINIIYMYVIFREIFASCVNDQLYGVVSTYDKNRNYARDQIRGGAATVTRRLIDELELARQLEHFNSLLHGKYLNSEGAARVFLERGEHNISSSRRVANTAFYKKPRARSFFSRRV